MFIFVPFSESIYSIKLSVHLVQKLSTYWIHMHNRYCCCCYFNSFTAYLLYMYYPLSAYVGDPNTSTQIIGFILFFCECSREKTLLFVVVLSLYSFSHAFLLYIYVQTIRVVTHPHLKFVWIFVVVSFIFSVLLFVFRFCFHLFI